MEINEACRSWGAASLNLDIRRTMSEFGDERFDLITLLDALEHLSDPLGLLQECAARLNSGGYVFIQLPNRNSQMARHAKRNWSWYSAPDHLMHMTPESIRTLARSARMRVHLIRTVDATVDVWLEHPRKIPIRLILRLRGIPGLRRFRVRNGEQGGLIQVLLTPE